MDFTLVAGPALLAAAEAMTPRQERVTRSVVSGPLPRARPATAASPAGPGRVAGRPGR